METSGHISEQFLSDTEDGEISGKESDGSNRSRSNSNLNDSQQTVASSVSAVRSRMDSSSDNASDSESEDQTQSEHDTSEDNQPSTSCNINKKSGKEKVKGKRLSVHDTMEMMQTFMLQSGLIDEEVDPEDLKALIAGKRKERNCNDNHSRPRPKGRGNLGDSDKVCGQSPSEVTIYKNAVEVVNVRNESSSSDDMANTSDESLECNAQHRIEKFINDCSVCPSGSKTTRDERSQSRDRGGRDESRSRYHHDDDYQDTTRGRSEARDDGPTPEEQAERLVREAERSKARMIEASGNSPLSNLNRTLLYSVIIDKGYLQVAAHVDDGLKQKIQRFEYIDFARLLPQDKILQEEDHRLTLVNKGGVPYLMPASDPRDAQIQSYSKWDQAFRDYSEIITTKFPQKAQELIQYNYVIHMAAQTYVWENVYSYDKDFRIHIGRNPTRTWSVILQQALTMRLKDRIKEFNTSQTRGNDNNSSAKKDYCRRFQRGNCNDGIHCKYDHRCAICNKWGHGAHICRRRDSSGRRERDSHDRYSERNERYHFFRSKSPSRNSSSHPRSSSGRGSNHNDGKKDRK